MSAYWASGSVARAEIRAKSLRQQGAPLGEGEGQTVKQISYITAGGLGVLRNSFTHLGKVEGQTHLLPLLAFVV